MKEVNSLLLLLFNARNLSLEKIGTGCEMKLSNIIKSRLFLGMCQQTESPTKFYQVS